VAGRAGWNRDARPGARVPGAWRPVPGVLCRVSGSGAGVPGVAGPMSPGARDVRSRCPTGGGLCPAVPHRPKPRRPVDHRRRPAGMPARHRLL